MTCRDVIAILADFLDQTLAPDAGAELEAHLPECEACTAYVNTYRKTRSLTARAGRAPMPGAVRARLRRVLTEELSKE